MTLEIKIENDSYTAILDGRLDTVASAQFSKDMQPLLDNADKEIKLDCSRLEYISSTGLRLFLMLRKAVDQKGGSLIVYHINDELRKVFTITGFFPLFDIRS